MCWYTCKNVITPTAPAASAISTGTILLLLVDLFGLGYFNFTLQHDTREHYIAAVHAFGKMH